MAADLRIARPEAAARKLVTAPSVPIREFAGSCGILDVSFEIKGRCKASIPVRLLGLKLLSQPSAI
jgi:hypothetical protein